MHTEILCMRQDKSFSETDSDWASEVEWKKIIPFHKDPRKGGREKKCKGLVKIFAANLVLNLVSHLL